MSDTWQSDIPGCFGSSDQIFSGHPADEDRAFDLLKKVRGEGVGWADVEKAVRGHLAAQGASQDHIDEQVTEVERHYRPWLLD